MRTAGTDDGPSPRVARAGRLSGLYAVTPDLADTADLVARVEAALEGGAGAIQYRNKIADAALRFRQAEALARVTAARGGLFIVNDDATLCAAVGADGVHLGDDDLPCEAARALLGPGRVIGVTARNALAIAAAKAAGADYVGVGPVFPSTTKPSTVPVLGLDGLRSLVASSALPVVAISGIGLSNIASVAATGVHSAAVASDLLLAPDLAAHARSLASAFDSGARLSSVGRHP